VARKFFGDTEPTGLAASAYDIPRPIVGSTEKLNFKKGAERVDKRPTSAWQTSAWQCFDAIGEVHFAFSLIGQIMSRVRLYAAVVEEHNQPPIPCLDFLNEMQEKTGGIAENTTKTCHTADEIVNDLILNAEGGVSNMLRLMALNLSVPGEMYFCQIKDKWVIASTDELLQSGTTLRYKKSRSARTGPSAAEGEKLPSDAFVARIWRPHPRWTGEPDSSMLGTLDDCELLILLQQAMRSTTRSRMNAGIMFIPEGITSFVAGNDGMSVEEALTRSSLDSVQDETAQATVVPQILKGPPDLGEKIKWIPYGRQIDQQFIDLLDKTLQRVLQGLDIPKEIVAGLSDAKFANAIVITDELFKAHVEPLVLLCIDSLTTVYLRPLLIRQLGLNAEQVAKDPSHIINRLVLWADTSNISTRPDKSQAANEGYDRHALSAQAWRDTRGFSESDKPSPLELLIRLVLEKGQPPPDMVETIIRSIDPNFFAAARAGQSEIPEDIESLLNPGEVPPAPAPEGQTGIPIEEQMSGAPVNPNGALPPRPVPMPVG
jgi:hypothetical protein